jgi:DNA-directed RNA polymerase alpha subunit
MQKSFRQLMEESLELKSVMTEDIFSYHLTTEHTHALGAIRKADIKTVAQLLEQDIYHLPGSGKESNNEVLQALILCYIKQGIKYIESNAHCGTQKINKMIRD